MGREVQSSIVEKSVAVMDLLAQTHKKLSYSEIVVATGFNKSSTHRILAILIGQQLIQFDEREKSYTVGPKLVSWARAAWQKTDLSQIENQDLIKLSELTGMNVAVSVLSDQTVTFIKTHIVHPYKLAVKIGGQSDLHCTAAGKVFLASMEKPDLDRYLATADLEKYTETTPTDHKSLLRDISHAQEKGFAIANREEFWQVVGIAAPIVDYDNRVLAALSLWTLTRLASLEAIKEEAEVLMQTASQISARFGSMLHPEQN